MNATMTNAYRMGFLAALTALGSVSAAYAQPAALVTTVLDNNTVLIEDGDTVDLGEVSVGESTNFQFQVHNQGDGSLAISTLSANTGSSNLSIQNAGFSQVFDQFACGVLFTADGAGAAEFEVSIASNDPESPLSFTVLVSANAPQLLLANGLAPVSTQEPLEIDPVEVGQVSGAALTARNIGTETLNFIGAAQVTDLTAGDAADVTIILPNSIQPGGLAVITIAFEPTTTGTREFLVNLNTNDPESPYAFTILTEGLEPVVEIEDCNLNGIDDADDLAAGTHFDCDLDGLLDDCETDTDGDGVVDDCDECPSEDDLLDTDGDTVADCLDNCPLVANVDQSDTDNNGIGDTCEEIEEVIEDCNGNGIDDATDLVEGIEDDCNGNNVPDSCEEDTDSDGVINGCDVCPDEDDLSDGDNDGVVDCLDNCPDVANFNQVDDDDNGVGDACEEQIDPVDPNGKEIEEGLGDLGGAFCGAGTMAMIPMMVCGLCGMRSTRRRQIAVIEA